MSSGIPSFTILSEEQKFNGNNLLQWKTNMKQLLGSKGLLGYIDGKIPKPTTIPDPATSTPTPVYSSVVAAQSWCFAIFVNKFCKIMKVFEKLDHLKSWWVLCQH